jgi:transglutaminase-like putative cysteine protease
VVYRYGWLAAIAGGLLALFRLERLLRSSAEGLPWELVLLAAAVLGAAIAWATLAYRFSLPSVALVNGVAGLLTAIRAAVPDTTWLVFPTLSSFRALGTELRYALDVVRTGVAPVLPTAGVIAILTVVFWVLGALVAWGLQRDRPYVAVLSPLVVYLQFATMDRRASGAWIFVFLAVLGLSLLAVAADRRRRGSGLLTMRRGRAAVVRTRPAWAVTALALLMVATVLSTSALAGLLPRNGLLDWRVPSILTGDFYGSVSLDPFVSIRQGLLSPNGITLFYAVVDGDVPDDQIYFRLLTLETFNGTEWGTDDPEVARPEELDSFEEDGAAFHGPTAGLTQQVTIVRLYQDWLPAVYSPAALASPNRSVEHGFRIKVDDASLHFDVHTYYFMTYTVFSAVPQPDLGVLALGADGALSPVFAAAAQAGQRIPAAQGPLVAVELPEAAKYLALPDGIDPQVAVLAHRQVTGLETNFEKGLALEAFFRDSGAFRYSAEVSPGHTASDLAAWLLDPDSPNYRTGYCEQFATAMAVMARQVGVPSRVVLGFAPGERLEDGRLAVLDRNAHAWVELWMPTQGWVRFDPTPRGDAVNPATSGELPFDVTPYLNIETTPVTFAPGHNPPQSLPRDDEDLGPLPIAPVAPGQGWRLPGAPAWLLLAAAALLLALGLIPGAKAVRRSHRLRALATGDVAAAWWEIVDRLSDLGEEPSPATTPAELAAGTDTAMGPLARVYGETIYGPPIGRSFDLGHVVTATRSLEETEGRLAGRYSRTHRLMSWYRLRSLAPRRWRPRPRR